MFSSRHMMIAAALLALCVLLIGSMFIYPNYRKAAGIRSQVRDLQQKMADLEGQTQEVERLARDVRAQRMRMEAEHKAIPSTPDMSSLMQKLSQPVDYINVVAQNLTTGSAADAIVNSDCGVKAMPLTVDMEASFESVFALIRSAESVHRLVRVASLRVSCKHDEKVNASSAAAGKLLPSSPIVKATIGLEAIYDPPAPPPTPQAMASGKER